MMEDAKEGHRRMKMGQRIMRDRNADAIFRAVVDQYDKASEEEKKKGISFSKEDMIRLVRGDRELKGLDWYTWDKACTAAINKIRRYYWNDKINTTDKVMFNFIRPSIKDNENGKGEKRYWFIHNEWEIQTDLVYEAYDTKMKGIITKQQKIAESLYKKSLQIDADKRKELIKQWKDEGLINGEQNEDSN